MNHLPTEVLLDKADEVNTFAKEYFSSIHSLATKLRLEAIDAELLSRMPEGEFVTMLDESGIPVGFEPYLGV